VEDPAPSRRLESWKEIAAYLRRSERTVRRWEANEALPVHRLQHDKRGSVYAYESELDAWRTSRTILVDSQSDTAATVDAPPQRRWLAGAAMLVMVSIAVLIVASRRTPATTHTPNPEAVRTAQRARFGDNAGRVQVQTGVRLYQEAVRIDPNFAIGWSGLATAHVASTWFADLPATETLRDAQRAAHRALKLDPSLGGPWRVLGFVSHTLDWDHAKAERELRQALSLNPRDAVAASWLAECLVDLRRFDEALMFAKQSQEANPRWLGAVTTAGNVHYFMRNPDLAIAEYRRALETEPNYGLANHFLGRAYLAKGMSAKAVEQLRHSDELLGHVPFSRGDLGYALAVAGRRDEAERMLSDLERKRSEGYFPAFPIAEIELGLGRTDAAMEWLERGVEERQIGYYFPAVDPFYDPVQSHPRFRNVIRRLNLPTP